MGAWVGGCTVVHCDIGYEWNILAKFYQDQSRGLGGADGHTNRQTNIGKLL